jgi:hypothetical protein
MDQQKLDPEVAAFVRERKLRWLNWGLPLIFVAVVFGGIALYAALGTKPARRVGDPCESSSECGGVKATCLVTEEGSFCTPTCEKETDCPPGYGCFMADLITKSGGKTGTMMRVCQKD